MVQIPLYFLSSLLFCSLNIILKYLGFFPPTTFSEQVTVKNRRAVIWFSVCVDLVHCKLVLHIQQSLCLGIVLKTRFFPVLQEPLWRTEG